MTTPDGPAAGDASPSGRVEWNGAAYDRLSAPQARWGRAVVERLVLGGNETVLDAGCGSGRVTEELVARVPEGRVVALDASASMLDEARRRLRSHADRVRFVRADLLALDRRTLGGDAPVDAVLSTATLHWITDHDRVFANLAAVMRPGAQLVAQCGAEGNIARLLEAAHSVGVERAGSWLYAAPEETARRLGRAGFVDVDVWTNPEPTSFADEDSLGAFLETVCLREHLATVPRAQWRPLVQRVIGAMADPVIDYVRLNIVARRALG